jgi:hypothetical protein
VKESKGKGTVERLVPAKSAGERRPQQWRGSEKTPFVAVKLDPKWAVDLYFLCPADGNVNTEMVSSWNGLDSVIVKFDKRDAKRLKGLCAPARAPVRDRTVRRFTANRPETSLSILRSRGSRGDWRGAALSGLQACPKHSEEGPGCKISGRTA